jgi:hypothetical protein
MAIHVENDASQTITTVTELAAIAAVTPPVPVTGEGITDLIPAVISGVVNVTQGTTGTAVVVRVRHGINTITGAVIGNPDSTPLAAAVAGSIPFEAYDPVGDPAGYTATVQLTGATANGTVNNVSMDVIPQLCISRT